MKKSSILFICVLLVLVTVTGCKKKEVKYNKETTLYSIISSNNKYKVSFELANELGYTLNTEGNKATLRHQGNYSVINVTLLYDYSNSASISKKETDFYSDYYKDYKTVKVNGFEGWSIVKETNIVTDYQTVLVLTSADSDKKVYALDIKVTQSPLQNNKDDFNTINFINSDDFKHLLNTIKIEEI